MPPGEASEARSGIVSGVLREGDVERVTLMVLESYQAAGLIRKFSDMLDVDEAAVWSELMASFSAGYRDAVSHGLSHVHFERSAAALVPISVLTCVPFFDWLEGSGISAELSTLNIPAIQPLHPGGGPRHRMGWYFRTRAVLMLEGLRRVASVVGADEHAALAQSVYFAAGATGQRHQRGGMGRTGFEKVIDMAKAHGSRLGWGFTINPEAMFMNGRLANGGCRIVGSADLAELAEGGAGEGATLLREAHPRDVISAIERPDGSKWPVWVVLFDFYDATQSAFPRCPTGDLLRGKL